MPVRALRLLQIGVAVGITALLVRILLMPVRALRLARPARVLRRDFRQNPINARKGITTILGDVQCCANTTNVRILLMPVRALRLCLSSIISSPSFQSESY